MPASKSSKSAFDVYSQQRVRSHARTMRIKRGVGQRDGCRCFACGFFGGVFLTVKHHIKPVAKGGDPWRQNIVSLCPNCHSLVHSLSKSWWCTVYQLRDSLLAYKDIAFGRAFKLALIATEEVVIEDDRTIWPRTHPCPGETLKHPELQELLYAPNYWEDSP